MLSTLDFKSIAIGIALAMFVLPYLLRMIAGRRSANAS